MLLFLLAYPIHASPPVSEPVRLEWSAPAACPAQAQVQETLQRRWNADPGFDPSARVEVQLRVEAAGAGLAANLHVAAPSGVAQRRLTATKCETIVEAAALIVAMTAGAMVEPAPASGADLPPPPPSEETAPAPPTAPPQASESPTDPSGATDSRSSARTEPSAKKEAPQRPLGGQVQASGGLGVGGITTVAGSVGGGAGLTLGRWQLDAVGRFWFVQRLPVPDQEQFGARVRLWTLGPRVGPVLRWSNFESPLQLGLDAGLAHAEGYGVATPRSSARPWLSVGLFPAILWRATSRLSLGIAAELSAVLLRPRFTIADVGRLPSANGARGGLSARIQVRFP